MFTLFLCLVLFVLGFIFGLFTGLSQKLNKAKIENNNDSKELKPRDRKTLAYAGASEVNIDYSDFEGNVTNRNISIKYIYEENNKLYIRAFCFLRNEMRTFKIENILKLNISGAEVGTPENYFNDKIEELDTITLVK